LEVFGVQIRQLLFPGVPNMKADKGFLELQRTFKVPCHSYSGPLAPFIA